MNVMLSLKQFLIEEDGQTAVEYAVMLAMIVLSCIISLKAVSSMSGGMWSNNIDELQAAGVFSAP